MVDEITGVERIDSADAVESTVDLIEVENSAVVGEIVDSTPEVEVEVIEATKSMDIQTEVSVVDVTIDELRKNVADLNDLVTKLLGVIEEARNAQPQEEKQMSVEFGDEQIEKIAGLVAEKLVTSRKGVVYGRDTDEQELPKKVDVKALGVSDLSNLIVGSIALRSRK